MKNELDTILASLELLHSETARIYRDLRKVRYARTRKYESIFGPLLPGEKAIVRELSRGRYVAVPTLAGHLGMSKGSIHTYLTRLRSRGYNIQSKPASGGYLYKKIYRIDRAA